MSRTLLPGDRLLAARFWYAIERPKRGDIVVLHPNGQGDRVFYADGASRRVFVKRIVALPGEWVKARHGRISICTGPGGSGCVPLAEPYVRGTTQTFGPIAVPPGPLLRDGRQPRRLRGLAHLGPGAARSADRARVRPRLAAAPHPLFLTRVCAPCDGMASRPPGLGVVALRSPAWPSPSVSAPLASSCGPATACSATTARSACRSSPAPTRRGAARSPGRSSRPACSSTTGACRAACARRSRSSTTRRRARWRSARSSTRRCSPAPRASA